MHIYVKYWQDCNNKCSFCNQRLGTKVHNFGKFVSPSKESLIVHSNILFNYVENTNLEKETIHIKLMGGELFHRADIKELYKGFDYVIETLEKISNLNKQYKITVFSNLLYENLSLIKHFINNSKHIENLFLKSSFDLDGRFSSNEQIKLFLKNLNILEIFVPFELKSIITKQTLKNFNADSYVWKVYKDLLSKNKLTIGKFKSDNIDERLFLDFFELDDILPENLTCNKNANTILSNSNKKYLVDDKRKMLNNEMDVIILNNNIQEKYAWKN